MATACLFSTKALLFCVMVAVVKTLKPHLFLHECTQLFPGVVYFERLLPGYKVHHKHVDPREHGCPVRRPRVYDACLRDDFVLGDLGDSKDLDGFHRLFAPTTLNTGVFLQAGEEEASHCATAA